MDVYPTEDTVEGEPDDSLNQYQPIPSATQLAGISKPATSDAVSEFTEDKAALTSTTRPLVDASLYNAHVIYLLYFIHAISLDPQNNHQGMKKGVEKLKSGIIITEFITQRYSGSSVFEL